MTNNNWGTPSKYIESARKVMGSIDTDPASNDAAQQIVKANVYYTEQNSGFDNQWFGNVWLNPPYGYGLAKPFMESLVSQYDTSAVSQAITLTNGVHDTNWWVGTVSRVCSAVCLPDHRIAFIDPVTGEHERGNDRNQLFTYLGDKPEAFCEEFNQYGLCVIPQRPVTVCKTCAQFKSIENYKCNKCVNELISFL